MASTLSPLGATRPGAMRLRCWELAGADTRSLPSWESNGRPQRPQTMRSGTPKEHHRSKILQQSRIAQVSGNTLDSAQNALDSLSKPTVELPDDKNWDVITGELNLPPRGSPLSPGDKDRFFGNFSGTQVEAELLRLGMLVKGILRDLTTMKDSVWRLHDERFEEKAKVDSFERDGVEEVRAVVAKANSQLKTLIGQVDILDARVVTIDDCSAQFSELACRLELMDARLTACEEQDIYPKFPMSAMTEDMSCQPPAFGSPHPAWSSPTPTSVMASPTPTPSYASPEAPIPKQRGPSAASTAASGPPLSTTPGIDSRPSTTPGRVTSEGTRLPERGGL